MKTLSLSKHRKVTVASLAMVLSLALCLSLTGAAQATLTPDSGILIVGLPTYFAADAVTASTACHVNVTVAGTETNVIAVVTSNADGELSFSITFTRAGATTVEVGEGAVGSAANIQTGVFDVQDIMAMTMQFVVFIMQFIILFAIIGMVIGFVKFKR